MAVTMELYGALFEGLLENDFGDLTAAENLQLALLTAPKATAFDRSHVNISSIIEHEVDDQVQTDYARQNLTTVTAVQSAANTVITLDAANVSFGSEVSITAEAAVLIDSTGRLLAFIDFGEEMASVDGTFAINWHEDGIFKITIQTT